jgi:hypothetical protein
LVALLFPGFKPGLAASSRYSIPADYQAAIPGIAPDEEFHFGRFLMVAKTSARICLGLIFR